MVAPRTAFRSQPWQARLTRNAASHGGDLRSAIVGHTHDFTDCGDPLYHLFGGVFANNLPRLRIYSPVDETADVFLETNRQSDVIGGECLVSELFKFSHLCDV